METTRKLIITGIGKSYGGDVHTAKIEGLGKIEGDIHCYEFQINGRGEVQGSLRAATASVNGMGNIRGDVRANKFNLEGKLTIDGNLTGEQLRMNGMVTVKGNCETETFEANGRMDIGMLNAGQIKLTLQGSSHINEIGGEEIQIRKQPGSILEKWLKSVPGPFGNKLNAGIIEGDNIYLEHTIADVVRGGDVKIGPGCTIGSVEYKQSLDVHGSSKIIKSAKR
ncbi:polymer-forming cytoskeletal protein [Paenibacillus glycanilyticus]|uniref:polymer-forming cytoskeletal protein n=1 Tax=Paenibacillus glycanilyticus TaxID=126569 RepID=UPI00203D0100|nr:polymer-forming cytoskeletal protein [Paenibacillus glycanilyticus]MCM3627876.1 polymer-forming cytoskeletal protein [Paenibacillus glycanilyticus]